MGVTVTFSLTPLMFLACSDEQGSAWSSIPCIKKYAVTDRELTQSNKKKILTPPVWRRKMSILRGHAASPKPGRSFAHGKRLRRRVFFYIVALVGVWEKLYAGENMSMVSVKNWKNIIWIFHWLYELILSNDTIYNGDYFFIYSLVTVCLLFIMLSTNYWPECFNRLCAFSK